VDFATVRERDMAEMWNRSGQTKYCFPDVLRGVPDKTTRVDSSGIETGAGRGSDGASSGASGPVNTSATSPTSSTSKDSSGCSFSARREVAWPWCLAAALLAFRVRRRRG
jgi:hypothetical protein